MSRSTWPQRKSPGLGATLLVVQDAEATMLGDQPLARLYICGSKHLVDGRIHGWQDNPLNIVYSKSLSKAEDAGRP